MKMNRRAKHQTDMPLESIESNVASDARVAYQYLAATELEALLPTTVLQQSLTVKSIISTSSSFVTQSQRMKHHVDTQSYHEIGAGLQGTIYERLGSTYVTKKELPTNNGRRLRDEFTIHKRVWDAFTKYEACSNDVRIPQPYDYIPKESLSPDLLSRMPENDRKSSDMVTMERILPLPKVVRRAMIQQFYPHESNTCDELLTKQILDTRANKHCLARIYLGKETVPMSEDSFTLRNYPLTLDCMSELALDTLQFAAMIGSAYAIMHWGANITGDDVEFVLGTSNTANTDFQRRAVHMYLLDFGQCDTIDMSEDQDDIFQAFKGSMVLQQNQIYLPHPKRSAELYEAWKLAYLGASWRIILNEGLPFDPEEFLREYEEYLEDLDI